MTSQSIAAAFQNCAIMDTNNNENHEFDQTDLISRDTPTNEYSSQFELNDVRSIRQYHHNNSDNFDSKNKTKTKRLRNKSVLTSTENVIRGESNETLGFQKSKVWKYAIKAPNSNFATCRLCPDHKQISTNNGSTSTLRKHLITKHNVQELALPNNKNKNTRVLNNVNKNPVLHTLAINCIIRDGRTFNDFQKPGLKKLLQEVIPGYEPPSRFAVSRRLKTLHAFHQQKLINDLTSVDHISITTDFWTNRKMRCFLVITGHYYDKSSFNLKSTVLNFSTFDQQHKSQDISKILREKLSELNILQKVTTITSDGAPNIVRAIKDLDLNLNRLWCIAHRLHLMITNAYGFWVKKKDAVDEVPVTEVQNNSNVTMHDYDDMTDVEGYDDADELNDIDIDMDSDDTELSDDETMDSIRLRKAEELLTDPIDEETVDSWSEDVIESDVGLVPDQEMIITLVKKCRKLVFTIKRSSIITLYFENERKKSDIRRNLCYDVKSRWNSTYTMLDSFLAVREIIEKLFKNKHHLRIKSEQMKNLSMLELTTDDWNNLSTLHKVLKPFHSATTVMSARDYPSIGLGFYFLIRLKSFLQQHRKKESILVKRLKQLLMAQYVLYFENDPEQVHLLKFHSYFDPTGFATLTDSEKRAIEQKIKMMVVNEPSYSTQPVAASSKVTTADLSNKVNLPKKEKKSALDIFNESVSEFVDDSIYENTQRGNNKKAVIIDDIQKYRKYVAQFCLTYEPGSTSATLFWQTYGHSFQILANLAKKMLATPATSVPSESCFSVSSYLGRKERARLTGENLSSSVFLKDKIDV